MSSGTVLPSLQPNPHMCCRIMPTFVFSIGFRVPRAFSSRLATEEGNQMREVLAKQAQHVGMMMYILQFACCRIHLCNMSIDKFGFTVACNVKLCVCEKAVFSRSDGTPCG